MNDLVLPRSTERLVLRALCPDDAVDLLSYRSLPEVCRYVLFEPLREEDVAGFIEARVPASRQTGEDGTRMLLAVQLGDRVIGDVSLLRGPAEHGQGEIGWIFHPDVSGRGYATEAARELLAAAFSELGLHRVCAQLDPRNHASARLCVRLGMRREAHLREESWFKGEWGDLDIYAVLHDEWPAASPTDR